MNKDIMNEMSFEKETNFVELKKCPFCKKYVGEFKDSLSEKEFKISGLCQECQDDFFS